MDDVVAHLADGRWRDFDRIVFCSDWQAQGIISHFGVPHLLERAVHHREGSDQHARPAQSTGASPRPSTGSRAGRISSRLGDAYSGSSQT
jgi:hypothetical protein